MNNMMAIAMQSNNDFPPGSNTELPPNPYAKGLLKPFYKGKGGILRLRDELMSESDAMNQEAINFEQQYNPWLYSIGIAIKRHGDQGRRTHYLRWRDKGLKKMGDALFEGAMLRQDLAEPMRQQLFDIEMKRCSFNGRAGMVNQELRNLRKIIKRMERAESLFNRDKES
ncbi:DUF3158 family protein [Vreelandella nigrificans]|uniref:DUF3158 domain-containing protein n=1 Tax=Vreelandella nigrificans TaxID=2042704 RepID=A0A2A4HIZ8_9GAMM|nr:DUF3158 family protein [Halomonas nigrificans]PCF94063.1 hypothetical protein CPA45_18975 [Halomonas nigrificans]